MTIPDSLKETVRKKQRISRKTEIEGILRFGTRKKLEVLSVVFSNNSLDHDRYAVLVGRRNGNAVCRNRIKRLVREAVHRTDTLHEAPFRDILLRPHYGKKSTLDLFLKDISAWKNSLSC